MTPLQAIMESVVDELGPVLNLKRHASIDTRHDEKPNAHCGQIFVGVFPNSQVDGPAPDPEMGIDQVISLNIAVTQRTGFVPDDKMLREAAMHPKQGCLSFSQRIVREMQIRRLHLPYLASQKLESPWDGNFVNNLRLTSSAISIRAVDWVHFHAEPPKDKQSAVQCKDFGLLAVLTYSGIRYMENVISETQAVMT